MFLWVLRNFALANACECLLLDMWITWSKVGIRLTAKKNTMVLQFYFPIFHFFQFQPMFAIVHSLLWKDCINHYLHFHIFTLRAVLQFQSLSSSDFDIYLYRLLFLHKSFCLCINTNLNPLSANPTKWSNTLKQFVGKLPMNCLSVFDHFEILALKEWKVVAWSVP